MLRYNRNNNIMMETAYGKEEENSSKSSETKDSSENKETGFQRKEARF